MSLAAKIVGKARLNGDSIATAESCTGGLVCAAITDIAGSSAVLDRGIVSYSNAAKQEMLGVSSASLDAHGAVSEQIALEMVEGAKAHSNATVAVSVTGIAGPGGSDFKPEGRVCFGITNKFETRTETVEFGAIGRENVRISARDHALGLLLSAIS